MRMKRYLANDMRAALRQIRIEQGADAVILSTRQLATGVEVCAAIDAADPLHGGELLLTRGAASAAGAEAAALPPAMTGPPPAALPQPAPAAAGADNSDQDATSATLQVHAELLGLRRLLEQQLAALAWNDYTRREPEKAQALVELAEIGF